ncbi:MAG: hypothetical protein EBS01_08915 [Verrucomicrobia bacterium]|nr:hypothetical protein [Verrucomicrobiota bacterium]
MTGDGEFFPLFSNAPPPTKGGAGAAGGHDGIAQRRIRQTAVGVDMAGRQHDVAEFRHILAWSRREVNPSSRSNDTRASSTRTASPSSAREFIGSKGRARSNIWAATKP